MKYPLANTQWDTSVVRKKERMSISQKAIADALNNSSRMIPGHVYICKFRALAHYSSSNTTDNVLSPYIVKSGEDGGREWKLL